MTGIALLSQTLRADECAALLREEAGTWIVVVGEEHGPDEDDLPPGSSVVTLKSPLAAPADRLRSDLRRSALRWMRSGSRAGRVIERWLQKVRRLLTPADGASRQVAAAEPPRSTWLDVHTEEVLTFLTTHHDSEGVSEVVVFDLFDLPAAVAFGDQHDVPVRVR